MKQTDILLESGTNELEIVMFHIGKSTFGINVLKVREIIQTVDVTETPNQHEHYEGIIHLREEVFPVIDLAGVLGYPPSENPEKDTFIIAELNKMKVAFRVQEVTRIHRISWENIEKLGGLADWNNTHTIGVVKMKQEMALLLDYEKIVMDICPGSGFPGYSPEKRKEKDRSNKHILAAEDSSILQKMLKDTLEEAGYTITLFPNGKEAWEYINSLLEEKNSNYPDLIITDIEMPQMDGHHLTKKIKEHAMLRDIPVVIFSSLITDSLYHKGENVGADAQISKPEINKLIDKIDQLIL
ncbi:chemotaxis protein [Bacillus piscicola]|uniref:chemotaxis protein n=1 Tax=Bacillus piscicola TaxID=1632684 RepID=UPI001F091E08|nr:chemotaxis protein [Bacillus piscicola]